ncbi:hypothetical protein EV363DRAFT_1368715 [Boletus edulis]|nr:hypothetical protein EV363DRAFT_1368715 [Boletus edulis]
MPMKTRDKDQSEVTNDRATLRDVIPYGCSLFVMLTTTSSTLSPVFIIPWPARLTWPLRNSVLTNIASNVYAVFDTALYVLST